MVINIMDYFNLLNLDVAVQQFATGCTVIVLIGVKNVTLVDIGSKRIGSGRTFFIIEEGQASLGDFNTALEMIELAAYCGGDAIEFQLARAGDLYVKHHAGYGVYKSREFSDAQLVELVAKVKESGLEMIVAPLSHKLISKLVDAGCSAFNINASDLNNPDIIDSICDSGLPFFLSLPLATENEVDWAINRITCNGNNNFAILHGQHTMASGSNGVNVEDTSLGYISSLKERYNLNVGYIDHTPFLWMPASAVAAGADVISKHLTYSRSEKGPDWQICLEPNEMKLAIDWARKMNQSINVKIKRLAPGENMDRSQMRRSIVASKKIRSGEIIQREYLAFKRPGNGLEPSSYDRVVGKVATHDINKDDQISLSYLEDK